MAEKLEIADKITEYIASDNCRNCPRILLANSAIRQMQSELEVLRSPETAQNDQGRAELYADNIPVPCSSTLRDMSRVQRVEHYLEAFALDHEQVRAGYELRVNETKAELALSAVDCPGPEFASTPSYDISICSGVGADEFDPSLDALFERKNATVTGE